MPLFYGNIPLQLELVDGLEYGQAMALWGVTERCKSQEGRTDIRASAACVMRRCSASQCVCRLVSTPLGGAMPAWNNGGGRKRHAWYSWDTATHHRVYPDILERLVVAVDEELARDSLCADLVAVARVAERAQELEHLVLLP